MLKFLVLFFVSTSCHAETIPFKVKTKSYTSVPIAQAPAGSPSVRASGPQFVTMTEKESVVPVSTEKISAAIEQVRTGVCRTIKNGSVKMWFSATEKGSVVVAEASMEAGIEVQLNCVEGK